MKKTVHIIVKYFFPVTAGIETNVAQTYSRLVKNGWNVILHTSRDTYLEKDVLPEREKILGIDVRRYSFKQWGFFPKIDYKNADVIALHNFDIFPHLHLLLKYSLMKIVGQKKFALFETPHGGFNPEWTLFSFTEKLIKKTYHETLGKWLINFVVDGVRAVSEWERFELIKSGVNEKKVRTISNGLEDEAFDNIEKKASPGIKKLTKTYGRYLFGNARIYEIKNQETIIKALPLIPKDVVFVNIGTVGSTIGNKLSNDKYLIHLKKLAKKLKVSDRVIFPGVVKGADKYYLFKNAVAFVHMAIWESFCNVVHEAISQGQVCIVANNTALPFLVKDNVNGFLVPTHDYKELAKKINFVLDEKNKNEIQKIKSFNLKHGKENSWANVSKRMESFYLEHLNK